MPQAHQTDCPNKLPDFTFSTFLLYLENQASFVWTRSTKCPSCKLTSETVEIGAINDYKQHDT